MLASKATAELVSYIICTIFTVCAVALCLAGLCVPYWYEVTFTEGIVKFKVDVGLWQDRVCMGMAECTHHWINDYDRHVKTVMPSGALIRWFETMGVIIAILTLISLVFMWMSRKSRQLTKTITHIAFFVPCMISAFLSVVGTLILASKGEQDNVNWAPFLSGVGGALLFLAGCLSCVVCRYDPSYGTLENPVSPKYLSQ